MDGFGMERTPTSRSLLLLILLSTCFVLAAALEGVDNGSGSRCEALTDEISDTEFVLDTRTLQLADGDVQRVLDCMPEATNLLVDMDEISTSEDLVIEKPMVIQPKRGRGGVTISGGGVKVRANNATVKGVIVEGFNRASKTGLIDVQSAKNVVIEDVRCSGCSNSKGPSCLSARGSSVTIKGLSAIGNSGVYGGAGRLDESTITISDSLFKNNTASERGGGLHMANCGFEMENTVFQANNANSSGGGVWVHVGGQINKSAYLSKCSFIGNKAQILGGGMYYRATSGRVEVVNSDVRDNTASLRGGGGMRFTFADGTNAKVKLQSTKIINNSAQIMGGGVHFFFSRTTGSAVEVDSCEIRDNSFGNAEVLGRGGGLFISMDSSKNGELKITNSGIATNSADRGGGFTLDASNSENFSAFMRQTRITSNKAVQWGGGAQFSTYQATNGRVTIFKSNIEENSAPRGAGTYFDARRSTDNNVRLLLSTITKNHGGKPIDEAIFVTTDATDFKKTVFKSTIGNSSRSAYRSGTELPLNT